LAEVAVEVLPEEKEEDTTLPSELAAALRMMK